MSGITEVTAWFDIGSCDNCFKITFPVKSLLNVSRATQFLQHLHLSRDVQVVPRHPLPPREQVRHGAHHVREDGRDVARLAAVTELLRLQQVLQPRGNGAEHGGRRLEVAAEQGTPEKNLTFDSYVVHACTRKVGRSTHFD